MSYRIALERLRAYEPKRLIRGEYFEDGDCCAIGVIVPRTHPYVGTVFDLYLRYDSIKARLDSLGMTLDEAEALQRANDRFLGTPRQRYAHILAWLEAEVAKEKADAR